MKRIVRRVTHNLRGVERLVRHQALSDIQTGLSQQGSSSGPNEIGAQFM
jgi:hypothetical protein